MSKSDPFYSKMALLDRLEDLLEEMEELGITDVVQLIGRIEALEREIDDLDDDADAVE